MIKLISLTQLNLAQKNFYYKQHTCEFESVFLYNKGQEVLNIRAYNLCKFCGRLNSLDIDEKMDKEIKTIIDEKDKF
jgi:hypothetical protein